MICDLRSDVLGPLSAEVMEAFRRAAARPPGFGRHDDCEELALCREAAELFGFEDALFLPTGTLANQIAVRLWVQPGQAIIVDSGAHLATNEATSVAGLNGAVLQRVDGAQGHPSLDQIEARLTLRTGSAVEREPHLIWLENTHNRSGGTIMPAGQLGAIVDLARRRRVAVHVDGARIWNVLAATNEEPQRILQGASSAMVALNKIAGAPIGALLLGGGEFIEEAARIQKMFGGLWRPVGSLAAAAKVALRQWPSRARAAHEAAALFASGVARGSGAACRVDPPQTNIVMLRLASESHVDRVLAWLADSPVRVSPYGDAKLRCVFHSGIPFDAIAAAADIVAKAINGTVGCAGRSPE